MLTLWLFLKLGFFMDCPTKRGTLHVALPSAAYVVSGGSTQILYKIRFEFKVLIVTALQQKKLTRLT
jgi:hypothetical protein